MRDKKPKTKSRDTFLYPEKTVEYDETRKGTRGLRSSISTFKTLKDIYQFFSRSTGLSLFKLFSPRILSLLQVNSGWCLQYTRVFLTTGSLIKKEDQESNEDVTNRNVLTVNQT